jgi:hypothetical protein
MTTSEMAVAPNPWSSVFNGDQSALHVSRIATSEIGGVIRPVVHVRSPESAQVQ